MGLWRLEERKKGTSLNNSIGINGKNTDSHPFPLQTSYIAKTPSLKFLYATR
jgi:hypothetical protein